MSSLSCVCFNFLFFEFCLSCLIHLSHALCEWTTVGAFFLFLFGWLVVHAAVRKASLAVRHCWPITSSLCDMTLALIFSQRTPWMLGCLSSRTGAAPLQLACFFAPLGTFTISRFFFSFSKMTPECECGYFEPPPIRFLAQTRPCHQHSDSPKRLRLSSRAPSLSFSRVRVISQPISQRETDSQSRPAFIIWIWGQILSREKAIRSPFVWCRFAVSETRLMKCYVRPRPHVWIRSLVLREGLVKRAEPLSFSHFLSLWLCMHLVAITVGSSSLAEQKDRHQASPYCLNIQGTVCSWTDTSRHLKINVSRYLFPLSAHFRQAQAGAKYICLECNSA